MNTSLSNPTKPSENRHFGFWGNLRLVLKLMLAFGVVLVFVLIITGVTLWGMNRVTTAYEDTLAQGITVRTLSDLLANTLLQARRAEKNFIMRWQSEGFDTAYENYVTLHPQEDVTSTRGPTYLQNVAAMRELVKQLAPFGPVAGTVSTENMTQVQYEAELTTLGQNIDAYEQSFNGLVEASRLYGENENIGFLGDVRNVAHDIEAKVSDKAGLENLEITLLQIRRHEKDYLARKDQIYIEDVHTSVAQFKTQVAASDLLQPAEKTGLGTLADQYQTAFDVLVAKDKEITQYNDAMIAAGRGVESVTAKIETLGEQLAADGIITARTDSTQTFTFSMITIVIILALTILISITLSRQITRPVISLTNTAEQIASGNFDAHAEVSSGDEIGTLANTFNSMTGQLKTTMTNLEKRTQDLATVAKISTTTATIPDPFEMLTTVVHLTQRGFNLYHAHVFTYPENLEELQIVACGYKEGDEHEGTHGTTSIPLTREQSLVARAARTRQAVIVNDVRSDPGWLPNPLLPDTHSELAVPLIVGDELLGVLDVQSERLNAFTDEDANIQMTLAAQIATALKNALSYNETQKRAELESQVNAIGQKIQRTGTVEETLQTAARELGLALGAPRVSANIDARRQSDVAGEN